MVTLPLIPFNKPPLNIPGQIQLLLSRGLVIRDHAHAEHYLKHIGYYRLSGYAHPFQIGGTGVNRHNFTHGVTFEMILDRYVFDRKLRLLVLDTIERIEISLRATLTNVIAPLHGAHWYMLKTPFDLNFNHTGFIDDIKRQICHDPSQQGRRDIHIEHYYQTYSIPDMPPAWMVFESVSFGTISYAYKNLAPPGFSPICSAFGLPNDILKSWLHSINYIRNICAHHGRLWNRECRIKPKIAKLKPYTDDLKQNDLIYAQLVVMQILLATIAPGNHWAVKLRDLLAEHPAVPLPRSRLAFAITPANRIIS